MLVRYKAIISYDGSKFNGFQKLKTDKNTIQELLEKSLSIIAKKKIFVKGSGRTDKGVHAINQCIHFDMDKMMTNKHLIFVLNNLVRPYINIKNISIVNKDFHARFNCIEKTYTYIINNSEYDLFKCDYEYYIRKKLDIKKMQNTAKIFVGTHNFKNFVCSKKDNYNLTINNIKFKIDEKNIKIIFYGKSFYTYMVRNIVGVLIMRGLNKITDEEIIELLNNANKTREIFMAPASGLYLTNIKY